MMDPRFKGYATQPSRVTVDAWRVKLFCQAIGETDAVHWDAGVAHAAGHPACPVPPTFLKALESDHFSSAALLGVLKVSVGQVLHAEQSFEYSQPVYAGDTLEISRTVTDLYDKREGTMGFVVVRTDYQVDGQAVASSIQTIMVRQAKTASV
jgi:acyl dehydratase